MRKVLVYCGTRNLYPFMYLSMMSALEHNTLHQIYFFIEDDIFPFNLPENVTTINIAKSITNYFPPNSEAYASGLTYMSFLRLILGKLLPNENYALYVDCDTLVVDNLDDLFNLNMTDKLYAAVHESETGYKVDKIRLTKPHYYNSGVVYFNLDLWRQLRVDEYMLFEINHYRMGNGDQTLLNLIPETMTIELPYTYNQSLLCDAYYFQHLDQAKIFHWPGLPLDRYWKKFLPYAKKYLPNPSIIKPRS